MLKRLYKRFLEWALAPVLGPVTDEVNRLQSQCFSIKGAVAVLNQATIAGASIKSCQIADD